MMTRREFARLSGASVAATVVGELPAFAVDSYFLYPDSWMPIISAGQSIRYGAPVTSVEVFQPLFGADRPHVNAVLPKRDGVRALRFDEPGEYYLVINGQSALKVLVLHRDEPISRAMLRFFDFCTANLVWGSIHDPLWYNQRPAIPKQWFESRQPLVMLCGPTHQLFRDIIRDRFALPTRVFTLPGVFRRQDGTSHKESHNIAEVYLPDVQKWVLFDMNNGYVPLWLDAMELAEAVASKWGPDETASESVEDLGVRLHVPFSTRMLDVERYAKVAPDAAGHFDPALLASQPLLTTRTRALRLFGGGVAYWGAQSMFGPGSGTEFLPFGYAWAALPCDDELREHAAEWTESFGHTVNFIEPRTLRRLLHNGHEREIARRAWSTRFPASG